VFLNEHVRSDEVVEFVRGKDTEHRPNSKAKKNGAIGLRWNMAVFKFTRLVVQCMRTLLNVRKCLPLVGYIAGCSEQ